MRVVLLATRRVAPHSRVLREAAALADAGHEVTVISFSTPGTDDPAAATYRVLGAHPHRRWPRMLLRGPLRRPGQVLVARRHIRRLAPDVIHVCGPRPLVLGWLVARTGRSMLIWDAAGIGAAAIRRRRLAGPVWSALARAATAVVARSDTAARLLERRHGLSLRPVVVRDVPDLADIGAPARLGARLGLNGERLVIALAAGLHGRECDALIRGAARVPDVHVAVLGASEWRDPDRISLLAEGLGMGTRLHLLKEVPPERLPAYLDEADVVAALGAPASGSETPAELAFSIEAGIPLVAGTSPEIEELVEQVPRTWLVDPTDPRKVAAALQSACEAAKTGRAPHEDGLRTSWEPEAAQLIALYDRLPSLAARGPGPRPAAASPAASRGRVLAGLRAAITRRSMRHPLAIWAYVRGRARAARADYERAASLLDRAWRRDPAIPAYGLQLAAALRDARRPEDAVRAYEEVLDLHGCASSSLAATAAINLARLGARRQAEDVASLLEETAEGDGRTLARLAEVRAALGDLAAARAAIDLAVAAGADDRVVTATASRVLDQIGEPTRALDAAHLAGDGTRARRLTGMLRTLDPLWTPAAGEHAWRALPERRVLHLLETSLPYLASGYAHRTATVLRMQAQAGLEPVACTRLGFPASRGYHRHPYLENVGGVPHHRLGLRGLTRYTAVPPDELLDMNAALVAELAAARPPAVLQATTPHLNGLIGLAVRDALGVPLVYDVRGFPEMTWAVRRGGNEAEVYRLRRQAETRCMLYADAVFTLSGVMKDHIVSRGIEPEKVSVIPHCVDTGFFAPASPRPELRARHGLENRLVVGYVSSLLDYEGVDVLLRALAGAAPEVEGIAGLIVGDGPMLESLQALAHQLGIADLVSFAGRVPFAEIRDHYALIDVFVCPRKDLEVCHYVTPLKPFEAMSMERCVVVSDLPALAELTAGETAGLTFPPDDPDALAALLVDLAAQPDRMRALGRAARAHVEAHHSTSATTHAVLAGFDAVRGRAATGRA